MDNINSLIKEVENLTGRKVILKEYTDSFVISKKRFVPYILKIAKNIVDFGLDGKIVIEIDARYQPNSKSSHEYTVTTKGMSIG